MKTGKTKFLLAIGLTLGVASLGVALFGQDGGISNTLFTLRATGGVEMGTITFRGSNATKSGTTNTTAATTQTGGSIICKTTGNDSSQSSGKVGALINNSEVKFYEADGVTEYTFEDLEKISFSHGGTSFAFNLTGIYDDGTEFSYVYGAKTTNPREINFHDYGNVAHIRVTTTSSVATLVSQIVITYNCNHKSLSGVEIASAPTKTSYAAGDVFDPTGILVEAVYSNGAKVATEAYTYSPTTALTSSDTYVTVYYKGFSVTQAITVEDVEIDFAGTFNYISSGDVYSTLTLNNNGTGSYYRYPATYSLTWAYNSYDGLTLTKTGVSGDEPSRGQIFYDSDVVVIPTSRLTITSGSLASLRIYVKGVSTVLQTFTKA